MKLLKFIVTAVLAISITGCAARTQVKYYELSPDNVGLYKFVLPKSLIYIGYIKDKDSEPVFNVKSVPNDKYIGSDKFSLMMYTERNMFQQTNITQFTTLPNTRIPSAVGSEVIDNRKDMIETIGKLVGLAVLRMEREPIIIPTVIEAINADNVSLPKNSAWKYSLKVGNPPKDAILYDEFKRIISDKYTNIFPYSSCRDATLTLYNKEANIEETFNLIIADPTYVSIYEIPNKGKLTMHPSCGVDISSEKSAGSSVDWNLIGSIIEKAKSIKDEIDKNNNKSK